MDSGYSILIINSISTGSNKAGQVVAWSESASLFCCWYLMLGRRYCAYPIGVGFAKAPPATHLLDGPCMSLSKHPNKANNRHYVCGRAIWYPLVGIGEGRGFLFTDCIVSPYMPPLHNDHVSPTVLELQASTMFLRACLSDSVYALGGSE